MPNIDLEIIRRFLSYTLPQEWTVNESEQTTCEGPLALIRINSAVVSGTERKLVCFIAIRGNEVVIMSPDVLSPDTQRVHKMTKSILNDLRPIADYCLTLTECPLNCECCPNAEEFYK